MPADTPSNPPPSAPALKTRSPTELRAELERMVLRELLGPAGGGHEEIDEKISVHERYLVGALAPRRQHVDDATMDRLEVEEAESLEEGGGAEPSAPEPGSLFPSSFGLSFAIDAEASGFHVTASWGRYERADKLDPDGNARKVWRRMPVDGYGLGEGPPAVYTSV